MLKNCFFSLFSSFLFFALVCCIGNPSSASNVVAQDKGYIQSRDNLPIKVKYKKTLNIELSSKGINRISFYPYRIEKLVCDLSKFSIKSHYNSSDVFITSKVKAGSRINASAILSTGEPLDLSIRIVDSKIPKYIEIDFSDSLDLDIAENKKEEKLLIDAMRRGDVGKYYVRDYKNPNLLFEDKKIKTKISSEYSYSNLTGLIVEIKNKTSKKAQIDQSKITNLFEDLKASAFEANEIAPWREVKAYLVLKKEWGEEL